MEQYDDNNRGVLFRNDKGGNEARPDMTGELKIDGKVYRLAAWTRESKTSGKKFLSLTVQPREEQPATETPAQDEQIDSSIPF